MAASRQMTVRIADGSRVPQMTVRIADGSRVPQMTMRVAGVGDQPHMTVAIADGSRVPRMTVVLDGYSPASNYAARVLALSPIASYTLNGDATDSSGNGYNGTAVAPTFGASGIGDGGTAATFDGVDDYIDISALTPKFNGAQGSILVWGQTSAWADATARYLARLAVNSANQIFIQKATTLNTLTFQRKAANIVKTVNDSSLAGSTDFFSALLTWDTTASELKAYSNGVQVGSTQTGLATFVGTPAATTTVIGALATSGASSWSGTLAHVAIFDRALDATEALSVGVL